VSAPGEEEEFPELHDSLLEQLAPEGALEMGIFNILCHASWNLQRFRTLEAQLTAGARDSLLDESTAKAGFAAKFVVILSAVRAGQVALAVLAVACTVVSAFFYMLVAVLMHKNAPEEPAASRVPAAVSAALASAALVTLIGGISPGSLARWTVAP